MSAPASLADRGVAAALARLVRTPRPAVAVRGAARDELAPCRPGARLGPAPRRPAPPAPRGLARRCLDVALEPLEAMRERAWLARLEATAAALAALAPEARAASLERVRARVRGRGHDEATVIDALAHACLAAERTLGLVPHRAQRLAARAMLCGRFVEMRTGEGKTLATALAAAVGALDGTPVHVLTANDYLAERDATRLAPLHAELGLDVACALPDMDDAARRAAYAADVVHVTGKQVGFDRMRDALGADGAAANALRMRLGELADARGHAAGPASRLLRGFCLGLVDEADSLLVDEASVPLVLCAPESADEVARAHRGAAIALGLARLLNEGVDFRIVRPARRVRLTETGAEALERLGERVAGTWRAPRYRDERVRQALEALHLWHRDRDYVVRDGRIELVDARTGRALPDRRLPHGLHGLIERKERCAPTPEHQTIASLPMQRLFGGYLRLAGTSGTLREVRAEIARTCGARTVSVAPARPCLLRELPARAHATRAEQLEAMLADVRECLAAGRPTLIGTRTVEQSTAVSLVLEAHGVAHATLSAAQDAEEAAIVAAAGLPGRVTVATNMAGRGTDIALPPASVAAGGLHVICLAFNDARRIDRQLAGRAARQGDPGSWRRLVCLDDPALGEALPEALLALARRALGGAGATEGGGSRGRARDDAPDAARAAATDGERRVRAGERLALTLAHLAQRRLEHRHARQRHAATRAGPRLERHVAIGGMDPMDR